ncbi:mpv17 [Scenedesmus sp. PABB004]|nr:mpv17 [Scenedesmus sp. PABB004]
MQGASLPGGGPFGRLWGAYERQLEKHPILTQASTSAVLWGAGDLIAQRLEHIEARGAAQKARAAAAAPARGRGRGKAAPPPDAGELELPYDWRRAVLTGGFGASFVGPLGHFWYIALDGWARRVLPGGGAAFIAAKVLLDTAAMGPFYVAAFFAWGCALIDRSGFAEFKRKMRCDFVSTLAAEVTLWPCVQAVNFCCVPLKHQLLVVNSMTILDAIFMSWARNQSDWLGKARVWAGLAPPPPAPSAAQGKKGKRGGGAAAAKHKVKVISKIGQGAFGTVYRATYDGAVVAVKTTSGEESEDALRAFSREAQILQTCQHRNIIGFRALCRFNPHKNGDHDGRVPGGKWALVLEFAKGGTLSDKISSQMCSPGSRVYSRAQALSWALDVASGLEYLHSRCPAILHRDIKLSNVCLAAEEGQLVAKLSDFGLHVVRRARARGGARRAARGEEMRAGGRERGAHAQRRRRAPRRGGPQVADDTHDAMLRVSVAQAGGAVRQTFLHPCPPGGGGGGVSESANALRAQLAQQMRAAAPGEGEEDHHYSEVHDSRGSKSFVGRGGGGGGAWPPRGPSADPGSAAASDDGDAASVAATECTWITTGTAGVRGGSSVCSTDDDDSTATETVFAMTGRTGSSLYMAPEVFQGQPYNEKADVFSFGVLLYELLAKTMVLFTELPTYSTDPVVLEDYAEKVSKGYRPARPKSFSDAAWELVSACWAQEPTQRPNMSKARAPHAAPRPAARPPGPAARAAAAQPLPRPPPRPPPAQVVNMLRNLLQSELASSKDSGSRRISLQQSSGGAAAPGAANGAGSGVKGAQPPAAAEPAAGCSCVIS